MVITSLTAQLPEEIDLFQGEEILITEILDKSWARGKTRDGRVGLVPLGFVQMSSDKSVAVSFILSLSDSFGS